MYRVRLLSGSSIKEYCAWRWPDNISEQFLIVLDNLSELECKSDKCYALVYHMGDNTLRIIGDKLSYEGALLLTGCDNAVRLLAVAKYIIPMEAIN